MPSVQLEELSKNESGSGASGGPNGGGRTKSSTSGQQEGRSIRSAQHWPLEVRVRYQPSLLEPAARARRPTLSKIFQQDPGILYEETEGPGSEKQHYTLSSDEPLVLTSGDLSVLRIAPSSTGS